MNMSSSQAFDCVSAGPPLGHRTLLYHIMRSRCAAQQDWLSLGSCGSIFDDYALSEAMNLLKGLALRHLPNDTVKNTAAATKN